MECFKFKPIYYKSYGLNGWVADGFSARKNVLYENCVFEYGT